MTDTSKTTIAAVVEGLLKACNGHPHAKIAWPHRILHEAASLISALEAERDLLTKSGIVEVSIRNPNVADYMRHWEARAEAAEALNATLRAKVEKSAETLEPFASIADEYAPQEDDDLQVWKDFDVLGAGLPLRIFRAAHSTLSTLRETTNEPT